MSAQQEKCRAGADAKSDEIINRIRNLIQQHRVRNNMSYKDVGELIGISISSARDMLTTTYPPSFKRMLMICIVLNIDIKKAIDEALPSKITLGYRNGFNL